MQSQPAQPAPSAAGRDPRSRWHRHPNDPEDVHLLRRAVLTPHAAAAAAASRERRAQQRVLGAPTTPAETESRATGRKVDHPHPEYDPSNSQVGSLLYPDRTMYRERGRERVGTATAAAPAPAPVSGPSVAPASCAPTASSDAHHAVRASGGVGQPPSIWSATPACCGSLPPAADHNGGTRRTARARVGGAPADEDRAEDAAEVIHDLRVQVSALKALLHNGVCVPLPDSFTDTTAAGGDGIAHVNDEHSQTETQPQRLLRVWFDPEAQPRRPRSLMPPSAGWQWQFLS